MQCSPSVSTYFVLSLTFRARSVLQHFPGYFGCHLFSSAPELLQDNGLVHPRSSLGRLISFWLFSSLLRSLVVRLLSIKRKKKGDELKRGKASLSLGNFSFLSCHQALAPIAFRSVSLRVQTGGGLVFSPFCSCCSLKWYLVWEEQELISDCFSKHKNRRFNRNQFKKTLLWMISADDPEVFQNGQARRHNRI